MPEYGRRFGNDLSIGSTIYFQCFDGFELIGERFITCQRGAFWTASGPFCRAIIGKCLNYCSISGLYIVDYLSVTCYVASSH